MRVCFAHGLWSDVNSGKVQWMRKQGWDVVALEMRKYGWDQAMQTQVVLDALDEHQFDVLVGSSFGGLATANAAAMRPELALKLVLLAPAFGYPTLLQDSLGTQAFTTWQETGDYTFHPPDWENPVVLPWSFVEVAQGMAWPTVHHPTAILHGSNDDVVPLAHSQMVAAKYGNVRLSIVEDDHRLQQSLEEMRELIVQLASQDDDAVS